MVKSLHAIGEIEANVSSAEDHRVHLTRDVGASIKPTSDDGSSHDPAAAVVRALAEPLEYPPLAAGTVPGDQVAIALTAMVPNTAAIVRGAIEALLQSGIEPDAISIVAPDAATGQRCREALPTPSARLPRLVVHDPQDDENLCLAGATKRGEPLLVNRTIFDADIVLPIGLARLSGSGAYDSLFPWFCDAETIARHRMPAGHNTAGGEVGKTHEADEAGWLIGAPLVVRVVPGPGESVSEVVAGKPQAVLRHCQAICRRQWLLHCPEPVDLVIATITGDAPSQTWDNVGRALTVADRVLNEGGAVAICTNLDEPPGESLGRLIGSSDLEKTQRKIGRDHAEDSWSAWHLARALQRGPVYLLSQLAAETVEDMGMAPVADMAELSRLAGRHGSFILIEDSQHAVVTITGEEAE